MKKLGYLLFICSVMLLSSEALAHERYYAWTEIYNTLPKGEKEFEYWTTLKVPDGSASSANNWEYQGELEYGVTDHLTIAHYQRWQTENQEGEGLKDSTTYKGFKFEAKYRFFEKGKFFVDPLIYVEWAHNPQEKGDMNKLETKFVFSKDLDKLNLTYNQVIEKELGEGGRTNHEFKFGTSYELFPWLRPGFEMQGTFWHPTNHRNEFAVGPTVQYSNQWFWMVGGVSFGVDPNTDNVQARLVVGVPF
jgi:hypothetical protein